MSESITPYRKITELLAGRLKPKEAYLFYCLALKSDFITNESHITQESLAKFYGIKDADQIREWLYKFQSKGLLIIVKSKIKGQYGTFQRCKYILNVEHYNMISELLKDEPISSQLKGFLILLKCKCLNGTNTTKYSQNLLAKELGISVGAISQYMKDAIYNGYIGKDDKGIHLLREDIFLKAKTEFRRAKPVKPKIELNIIMD
jgi:hypothetical protein